MCLTFVNLCCKLNFKLYVYVDKEVIPTNKKSFTYKQNDFNNIRYGVKC